MGAELRSNSLPVGLPLCHPGFKPLAQSRIVVQVILVPVTQVQIFYFCAKACVLSQGDTISLVNSLLSLAFRFGRLPFDFSASWLIDSLDVSTIVFYVL